ncbi:MAG: hypothetical protein ACI8Y4_003272 [Candidatus Poriferisodalaceae bacterium]|jgi:hypothetical protein
MSDLWIQHYVMSTAVCSDGGTLTMTRFGGPAL